MQGVLFETFEPPLKCHFVLEQIKKSVGSMGFFHPPTQFAVEGAATACCYTLTDSLFIMAIFRQ